MEKEKGRYHLLMQPITQSMLLLMYLIELCKKTKKLSSFWQISPLLSIKDHYFSKILTTLFPFEWKNKALLFLYRVTKALQAFDVDGSLLGRIQNVKQQRVFCKLYKYT